MPSLSTLQRLEVEVGADTSAADRELRDFTRRAGSDGGGSGLFGGLATAGVAAFAAIGAGAAALGGWGLTVAMDAQNASIGFETMLGSGEAAQAFLGDLQAFAATTPFEFPELRDAASRLVAVGTETSQVIPLMEALGDATSGMGTGAEGINRAVTALTQMQQKGKVTGEEMLQLVEAGIPAWDSLATVLGTDVAGAQQMVSDGLVAAPVLFEALESRAGPAMERLSGLMEAQSQTLGGMLSTLKDTVGLALSDAMAPVVSSLQAQLPAITELIGSTLTSIGHSIATLATGLVDLLGGLLPVLAPIVSVIAEVAGAFMTALGPALEELAPSISIIAMLLGDAMLEVFDALAPVLPVVAAAVGDLARAFAGNFASILTAVAPLFAELVAAVLPLAEPLAGLATTLVSALLPALVPLIPPIIDLVTALVGTEDAAGPLITVVEALADVIAAIPTDVLSALIVGITAFLSFGPIVGIIGGITGAVMAFSAALLANPVVLIVAAVAAAAYLLITHWEEVSAFFAAMWDAITATFSAAWEWVAGFLGDLPGRIGGFFTEARLWLFNAGAGVILGLADGIFEYVTGIWDFWTGLPGRILGAIGDVGGLLLGVGRDLIQGFIDGIGDMFGEVQDRLGDLTNSLTSWKGPPSRDRVILRGAGQLIMAGLVDGIADGTDGVRAQLAAVTDLFTTDGAMTANLTGTYGASLAGQLAPLPASLAATAGSTTGGAFEVVVQVGDAELARVMVDPIRRELEAAGAANGGL